MLQKPNTKTLTLEEVIYLLENRKADMLDEFFPPQIRVRYNDAMEYYRMNYYKRPIVYEMYVSIPVEK